MVTSLIIREIHYLSSANIGLIKKRPTKNSTRIIITTNMQMSICIDKETYELNLLISSISIYHFQEPSIMFVKQHISMHVFRCINLKLHLVFD